MFSHSFAAEEICSASLAVENVQRLSDLSLFRRKNNELNVLVAKFFTRVENGQGLVVSRIMIVHFCSSLLRIKHENRTTLFDLF
jgi:hypothetical protein